jgi:hypothetical protein
MALEAQDGEKSPSPTVTLLVYNNAQAPAATISQAEREAGRILNEAGVRAVWLDCLDRHTAADPKGCAIASPHLQQFGLYPRILR